MSTMRMGGVRRGLVLACAAALSVLASSTASAATFYVDDDSPATPTPCTSPPPDIVACQTINEALTQARDPAFAGPDLIMVAAGSYNEQVDLNDPDDEGNVLDGAGTATGGAGTVIAHPAGQGSSVGKNNITVRDVAFLGSGHANLVVGNPTPPGPTGTVIENVLVRNDQPNSLPGISVNTSDDTTLDEVRVEGNSDWTGPGAYGLRTDNSQDVLISDSVISSNASGVFSRVSGLTIRRSVVRGPLDSSAAGIEVIAEASVAASLTLDSSLVFLGDPGLSVSDLGGSPGFALATVWNSTIDAGVPKGSDGTAIAADADMASDDDASVTFNSSIAVGDIAFDPTSLGTGTIFCRHSDVPDRAQGGRLRISCGTSPGNASGNSTTPANELFEPGFLIPSWKLLPDSPAIDTGDPADDLPGEQSATDLDGNPREVDGDCDAVIVRDKGAYERPTPLCAPPSPPPAPPVGDGGGGGAAAGAVGGRTCAGRPATHVGTSKRDVIVGTPGRDVIVAGAGNDRVLGFEGRDFICGNSGRDRLIGGKGRDRLAGGKGRDVLKGNKGRDKLLGNKGKDRLLGGKGRDLCKGGGGKDTPRSCERRRSL